jgi:hypothetical protein
VGEKARAKIADRLLDGAAQAFADTSAGIEGILVIECPSSEVLGQAAA